MDILLTVLIIIGALVIGPLLAIGAAWVFGGAVLGALFAVIVGLVGVELSGGVLLTCFIAGTFILGLSSLPNKGGKRGKSGGKSDEP